MHSDFNVVKFLFWYFVWKHESVKAPYFLNEYVFAIRKFGALDYRIETKRMTFWFWIERRESRPKYRLNDKASF